MDFDLTDTQQTLVSTLQSLFADYQELPAPHREATSHFPAELWQRLEAGGFLSVARDMGTLEAALLVLEAARLPVVVEVGGSALVAPLLGVEVDGPVAMIAGKLTSAHRNLAIATTALIDTGDDVVVLPVDLANVAPVNTILAYPFGRFVTPPDLSAGRRLGPAARDTLRQWQRIAIAAECAGAAQSAVAFTTEYVKDRQVFGRALGSFQAIHHRLAQCYQVLRSIRFMTLRAAWSRTPLNAEMAAAYAQAHIQQIVFDCHQFNGAIGLTTAHKLHFWTYRLRALASELNGGHEAHLAIADRLWPRAG